MENQPEISGRGNGDVKSTGVSQSVRETSRDESQCVPSQEKVFKTRDLKLPIFEGSLPGCSPHSAGYTRTRAALKGTNLRGQTPICGFLRVPAVFCGFLRKSAVFLRKSAFPKCFVFKENLRESAKICENQRKSAFGLGLSP